MLLETITFELLSKLTIRQKILGDDFPYVPTLTVVCKLANLRKVAWYFRFLSMLQNLPFRVPPDSLKHKESSPSQALSKHSLFIPIYLLKLRHVINLEFISVIKEAMNQTGGQRTIPQVVLCDPLATVLHSPSVIADLPTLSIDCSCVWFFLSYLKFRQA